MSGDDNGELEKRKLNPAADEPALDASTQLQLGRILSQYSQDLINQPVPDIFLALLAKLEAREREAP
ncbi:MAG TPA: NepR family anti-sigma factor [Methylocystis sp.]|nr:NepR family anti-sigma factor [Methylocystis sp.]